MDETDAWTAFLQTGSVLDYLTYTTIKNEGKQPGAGNQRAYLPARPASAAR